MGGRDLGRRERGREVGGRGERLGRRERGREVGGEIGEERGREVGRRAGERGRGGEERHHMTTTVPCRGVSIYTVHVHDVHYVYTCSTFTGVCERRTCVCVCMCQGVK